MLNSYWYFFKKAVSASRKIILLGYSGNDNHVNSEIANAYKNHPELEIIIVEHFDTGSGKEMWRQKLNLRPQHFNDSNLIQMQSILDYDFKGTTRM